MTQYALVQDDTIIQYGDLPKVWNDGKRDWDLRPMSDEELAELGWLPVVTTPKPTDTATTTQEYSVELIDDVPTEVWTERDFTQTELDNNEKTANSTTLTQESGEAVDKLVLVIENLNALTDLTNSAINANPAAIIKDLAREVKTVARQANREARMTSGKTDSTYTGPEEV